MDNFTSFLEGSIHLDNDSNVAFEKYQIYSNEDGENEKLNK
ncbi:MAG: hypothetical protein R2837_09630 [Aliarcobacter sp.]